MPPRPEKLGLRRILEFVAAPKGETFFHRKRIKEECKGILQVIRTGFEDNYAFRKQPGPFMYAVADVDGNTRYIGKSLESRLSGRWLRIKGNVHHKESRDHIIAELERDRGPLWLWGRKLSKFVRCFQLQLIR